MSGVDRPWPPLIVAANIPRAVRWRDVLLTLAAWAAFALLLDHEFALSLGALKVLGLGGAHIRVDLLSYLERLAPFLLFSALLCLVLIFRSVRTLRRRSSTLLLRQPPPLEADRQARDAGLDNAALLAARRKRIVVVREGKGALLIQEEFPAENGPETDPSATPRRL
jgi:hypothetical protein